MPEELDLLAVSNSNTLKTFERQRAGCIEERHKSQRTCADGRIAVTQSEGKAGGHRLKKGALERHGSNKSWRRSLRDDTGKSADKLQEIMSFVSNLTGKGKGGKSKGKGKGGKRGVQCWHCGKIGHVAANCWRKRC